MCQEQVPGNCKKGKMSVSQQYLFSTAVCATALSSMCCTALYCIVLQKTSLILPCTVVYYKKLPWYCLMLYCTTWDCPDSALYWSVLHETALMMPYAVLYYMRLPWYCPVMECVSWNCPDTALCCIVTGYCPVTALYWSVLHETALILPYAVL